MATAAFRDRVKGLKRVKARDVIGAPWNWRTHGKEQRAAVVASLEELGIIDALKVRVAGKKYQLFDGHLRQEVLEKIGPDTLIPVLVTDLTEAEAKKANLIFDPLSAMAGVNAEAHAKLAAEASFANQALADLVGTGGAEGQTDPDSVPEPPDKAITQAGDLWIMGDHRLYCGDSSKPEDVDVLLGGEPIHLVNTDPPYNVKVEPRSNNAIAAGLSSFQAQGKSGKVKAADQAGMHHQGFDPARDKTKSKRTTKKLRAKDRPLANDFVSDEEFERLLAAWFGNMARVLVPGRCFYIWGGYANCANYPPHLKASKLYFSQAIIWDKQHPVLTRKDFMGAHEWCFYGWREGAAHQFFGPTNATDLWAIKKVNPQNMVHLTEKPVELAARAMEFSSKPRENVLDLFGGSGSTLMGAEQVGRRAFLMELDTLYCDVIVKRWEEFTGKKAKRQK